MSVKRPRYFATATVNTSAGAALARREHAVAHCVPDEYAAIQPVVHRAGSALSSLLPVERLYVLSLGSRQAGRHVHWHLARRLRERMAN